MRFHAGVAAALLGFLLVLGLSGCGDSGITSTDSSTVAPDGVGYPASVKPFWVKLPHGRQVLCVWADSGDSRGGGSLSCDWGNAQ